MAGKHTFIIEGKTRGVDKSRQKVKGLSGALGGLATKAMSVGAAYFAAKGLINGIQSSLKLYAEQELAETKLQAALGKSITGLQRYASSLQQTTRFGDELIMQGMAQLAFFIKDEEQLKIATKATLDLASAKGMDLVQAADLVAKSVGSSTNALSRYGIAADGAVGSEERLLSITDEIANLFGGQAEATTSSYQGALDQLSNSFGDLQEIIGEKFAPNVQSAATSLKGMIDELSISLNLQKTAIDLTSASWNTMSLNAKSAAIDARLSMLDLAIEAEKNPTLMKQISDNFGDELLNIGSALLGPLAQIQKLAIDFISAGESSEDFGYAIKGLSDELGINEEAVTALVDERVKLLEQQSEINKQLEKTTDLQEKSIELTDEEKKKAKDAAILKAQILETQVQQYSSASVEIGKALGANDMQVRNLTIAQAIADALAGANKAFAQGGVLGYITSAGILAAGYNNVQQIRQAYAQQQAQFGFSGVVDEPTMFTVGEGGQSEMVNVTPLEGPNLEGPQGGGITVNVSGNVMSEDFVENELSERIAEAVRRGVDFGMS